MALLNPVYAFIVPFLFIVTVPLAIFAGITTTLAFSVLILRVLAVYLDIALSLVPQYLGGRKPRHVDYAAVRSSTPSPTRTPMRRWRRRRSSTALSAGTVTPVSEAGLGLAPSIGPERDFEGIGGWRVGGDDVNWTTINSRLELPDRQHGRSHHRSPSGPTTPGEGSYLMMKGRTRSVETKRTSASPNSSRARTPSGPHISFGKAHNEGYFPAITTSPKAVKKAVF